jgi:hypothetical protein
MKKIYNICLIALSFMLITTACDDGFDELNTSKTGAISLDPSLILNNAVISSSFSAGVLTYELGIVQQLISTNTGVLEGANFNKNNSNNTVVNWQNFYQNVVKYTSDVITRTKDNPARANLYNMARIVQANAFLILTDTYGNVPYEEGGKGYTEQIFFPAYQTQQAIYTDLIKELKEATAGLNVSGKIETGDVLYGGSIDKWKKLGFSLLLRIGMHLSEVDAALAQSTVAAAFAGGVILSNADNAVIRHDGNYNNNYGITLTGGEAANYYLAEPFVNALKTNSDPRLPAIAVRYVGATAGSAQTAAVATSVASDQFGMPMGSTDGDGDLSGASLPGGGTRYAYTQADRTRIVSKTSPMFLVTAAQCNLLLAEARFKNWINTGTTDVYFSDGIKAHMDQMALYSASSTVAGADRDAYAASMVATLAGNELKQINYEYWVASFLNGPEAWANFRRSGFPQLTANPKKGDIEAGEFITRLTYPPTEILVNSDNVQQAIGAQGADKLNTKVWWDK